MVTWMIQWLCNHSIPNCYWQDSHSNWNSGERGWSGEGGVPLVQVVLGGFWGVLDGFFYMTMISDGFQELFCFSSYNNFTAYRRVNSLLCLWLHVTDDVIQFFYSK